MVQKPSSRVLASLKASTYQPRTPQPLARCGLAGRAFSLILKMLLIDSIKLLNHLLREINRVLMIDHDLDGLLASFIDNERDSAFFSDRLCRSGYFLHILID